MPVDSWLPVKFGFPDGPSLRRALYEGVDWQIYETMDCGRSLVAKEALANRWIISGLLSAGQALAFDFAGETYRSISSTTEHKLAPVGKDSAPDRASEAFACAVTFSETRRIDPETSLHDGIYVEKISRILPSYTLSSKVEDDLVFGAWLSQGVPVSVKSYRRLRSLVGWLSEAQLAEVLAKAGFSGTRTQGPSPRTKFSTANDQEKKESYDATEESNDRHEGFKLAGRPELENFINEHIIDIIENSARYQALGIDFPTAVILHGPPGCGKTFAVDRLIEYLGWPSFQIQAASVASPYIHDTSRKIAQVFDQAMKNSPAVLVIDEMEAYLADRQMGAESSHHRVEEVAEFLRRIPEAIKNQVLIVAMTNRIEMIDPAILRRGRFDHVIKVDMASTSEILALLVRLVGNLPGAEGIALEPLAANLDGRPLSDVAFVVKEAARLAARSGKDRLTQEFVDAALKAAPAREGVMSRRKIGFL
jgi:hypothetical protein